MTRSRLFLLGLVGFLLWLLLVLFLVGEWNRVTAHADPRVVTLTNGDDTYHANKSQRGAQTILALEGNDRVWGGVGADTENGGPGDDRLHGFQPGADTLIGGPGWDVCVVSSVGNDTTRGCERVVER